MCSKYKRLLAAGGLLIVLLAGVCTWTGCSCTSDLEKSFYPQQYSDIVQKEAKENHVEEALIYAVIKAESGFDEKALSDAGAVGLMQVMPETFEWLLMRDNNTEYTGEDLYIPEVNIRYGVKLLAFLQEYYTEVETIAAAYNAGFGAVGEWLDNKEYSDDGVHLKNIPYPETAAYVKKVGKYYQKYKELYY